jgi:hypothetical protein
MAAVHLQSINPLQGYRLRLTLSDGSVIERDIGGLMGGPLFTPIVLDPSLFCAASVEDDTVVWPNGAQLRLDELMPPP